jgi:type II secretory pathway pseudopilin PulG
MSTRLTRRGFTIIEIVVASTLSAMLGLAIASVLVSSAKVSKVTVLKAASEQQVRELSQNVVRFVRSAVPPRRCSSPVGAPASGCLVVVTDGSPFVGTQTADQIVFYAYTDAGAGPLAAPDKVRVVRVATADNAVVLEVYKERPANGVTYTEAWRGSGTQELVRSLVLSKPSSTPPPRTDLFVFLDANGSATTTTTEIAVVVFNPQVRVMLDDVERIFGSPVFIALPSKGFGG